MAALKKSEATTVRSDDDVLARGSDIALKFAAKVYKKTNGPTAELKRVYQSYLNNERRREKAKA